MSRLRKWMPNIVVALSVLMVAVVFGILVTAVIEPDPLIDQNEPYQVIDNGDILPGGTLTYIVDRCANDPLSKEPLVVTTLRDLVSDDTGARYSLSPGVRPIAHGCNSAERLTIGLPVSKLPPGRYHLEGTSSADGRFTHSTVFFYTTSFEMQDAAND